MVLHHDDTVVLRRCRTASSTTGDSMDLFRGPPRPIAGMHQLSERSHVCTATAAQGVFRVKCFLPRIRILIINALCYASIPYSPAC